ncbi:hypothetical protein J2X65_001646 [Ancylobacter sp. 3268]|uniref:hypothetical protein n=1 Tax=Ancylobacter sp. 3268 TaxID=2817752 RepID=UPI0028629109|nr:hypothetical protein [Ancylobacter sp. 3268]MDR6952291.1 hypothetical protein [Ancylobacter sp. 3268]
MDFPETIEAYLDGREIRFAPLVRFDFQSGMVRCWPGFGAVRTNDGNLWGGTQNMGRLGPIKKTFDGSAPQQTFTLSGVDPTFWVKAKASAAEYYGRLCFVYLQFFDEHWQCLDLPLPFSWWRMHSLDIDRSRSGNGFQRIITLKAESPLVLRGRAVNGSWTDRDQQARFPGDRACERVMGMTNRVIVFPELA